MEFVEAHGARIPIVGFGTMRLKEDAGAQAIESAIRAGYRHLDTAAHYGNEKEVGQAMRAAGVPREDIFLTTKVRDNNLKADDFARSLDNSLKLLDLPAVDLLLIHWPNPHIPLEETMGALCKMKKMGFARHIGISNFTVPLIREAIHYATEPLVTNQFEWHPFLDQTAMVAETRRHGLAVTAYSPLARGRAAGDKTLKTIGLAHRKTAGQVCLRFLVQEGAIVIPRTSKIERLTENMSIFDFALNAAEMDEIRKLANPRGRIVEWGGAPEWDE